MSYKTLRGIVLETWQRYNKFTGEMSQNHKFQHEPVFDNLTTYPNASYLAQSQEISSSFINSFRPQQVKILEFHCLLTGIYFL